MIQQESRLKVADNTGACLLYTSNGAFWWKTLDGETYLNFKGSKPERGYCREEYR